MAASSSNTSSNDYKDYDRVPSNKVVVKYKYIEKLPRHKSARKQLKSHTCADCSKYYQLTGTADVSSRHRGEERPKTPENFWELDFPSEEECIKRGYILPPEPYKMNALENNKYYRKSVSKPWRKPDYLK